MRWDWLAEALTAKWLADARLVAALGGNQVFPGQASRPVRVPSVEYLFVGDREGETFNRLRLQVDYWAKGLKAAATLERRLRVVTHGETGQVLDGERCWLRYVDSRSVAFPADLGVVHRILDFDVELTRAR